MSKLMTVSPEQQTVQNTTLGVGRKFSVCKQSKTPDRMRCDVFIITTQVQYIIFLKGAFPSVGSLVSEEMERLQDQNSRLQVVVSQMRMQMEELSRFTSPLHQRLEAPATFTTPTGNMAQSLLFKFKHAMSCTFVMKYVATPPTIDGVGRRYGLIRLLYCICTGGLSVTVFSKLHRKQE